MGFFFKITFFYFQIYFIHLKIVQVLSEMHKKHLIPNFENKDEEERLINEKTDVITQNIVMCQRKIQNMDVTTENTQSNKLKKNIQVSLATKIQDLSQLFRKTQSSYLSSNYIINI